MRNGSTLAPAKVEWPTAVDLYHTVLDRSYGSNRRASAARPALKLLRMLDELDPKATSYPGNEYRALIAELDGKLHEAVRYRKRVLAIMDCLMVAEKLEATQFGFDDYSDQLDLLACLYLEATQYDEALAALAESEAFCKENGIPFDGKDIRADVRRAMEGLRKAKAER